MGFRKPGIKNLHDSKCVVGVVQVHRRIISSKACSRNAIMIKTTSLTFK
jgi:hypothetical protein